MSTARTRPPPSFPPHPGRGVANGFLGGRRFGFEGIVNNRISKKIGRKRGPVKRTSSLAMFLGAPFSDDGGFS